MSYASIDAPSPRRGRLSRGPGRAPSDSEGKPWEPPCEIGASPAGAIQLLLPSVPRSSVGTHIFDAPRRGLGTRSVQDRIATRSVATRNQGGRAPSQGFRPFGSAQGRLWAIASRPVGAQATRSQERETCWPPRLTPPRGGLQSPAHQEGTIRPRIHGPLMRHSKPDLGC